MRVVDCLWDYATLGKKVCEVAIEDVDASLDQSIISEVESLYEYVVVKVGDKNVPVYKDLAKRGYYFVENQLSVSFRLKQKDRMGRMAVRYLERLELKLCSSDILDNVLERIGNDLFFTDRIAIDPSFGVELANKRYRNWIRTTFDKEDTYLYEICFSNKSIGFAYFQKKGEVIDYLLGGLYKEYQSSGFGIMIPLSAIKFLGQEDMKNIETSISSNNLSVVRCYMECGYDISKMSYVFAKVM